MASEQAVKFAVPRTLVAPVGNRGYSGLPVRATAECTASEQAVKSAVPRTLVAPIGNRLYRGLVIRGFVSRKSTDRPPIPRGRGGVSCC